MLKNGRPYTVENGSEDKALISDLASADIKRVDMWIRDHIRESKTEYPASSYDLKHRLERDTGIYLTNNMFKDEMLLSGFNPKDPDELNWTFYIRLVNEENYNTNPFFTWVKENYAGSDSFAGDFAKDMAEDRNFPGFAEHGIILEYLEDFGACDEAIDIFERLWSEWKNSTSKDIRIIMADITTLNVDAVVNAANSYLYPGGGVCGAIYNAAGYEKLCEETDRIGECPVGSAVITDGFDLPAKYIIHAVGPQWGGGDRNEPELLRSAYKSALKIAVEHGCRTVAFPLISAGIYGYPLKDAWREALTTCRRFLDSIRNNELQIIFAVIDDNVMQAGADVAEELAGE